MKNVAIITAAGIGSRMNMNITKQLYEVNEKPLIVYTIDSFYNNKNIDRIVVVASEKELEIMKNIIKKFDYLNKTDVIVGGQSNGESIYNGIMFIKDNFDNCNVLIHDGDRCLVSSEIINNNIDAVNKYGSCVTAIEVVEALYEARNNESIKYIPRNNIYRIQTPYSYRLNDLIDLYDEGKRNDMDFKNIPPCILMQMLNKSSHLIEGSEFNFKITTQENLKMFQLIKQNSSK